ncbi:MAG: GH92 family glycosyl hydrolase [Flavobacterium sp.]
MKKLILCYFLCTLPFIVSCTSNFEIIKKLKDNTKYVNPFIGTSGHGHTFPGATVPYGMVQLSPDTRTEGWDACSGYHYTDNSILGFSHTHLSGTGIGDMGDILFMPFTGQPKLMAGTPESPDSGYRSRFSHKDEKAEPGYYAVKLRDNNIDVELTSTARAGFHKYTYNAAGQCGIIIDLSHTIFPDKNPSHEIQVINNQEIQGFKKSGGWAEDQSIFFHAKFNKPFRYSFYENGKKIEPTAIANSKKLLMVLEFETNKKSELLAKVGISSVDNLGALLNLDTEIPGWNFDEIKKKAGRLWQEDLDKVQVSGGTRDEKTIFYTSLYHTSISPNIFSDNDFRYRGMDNKVQNSQGKNSYTVFSLWDTFRAFNPLKTILDPIRANDFITSLIAKYDEGGILPMWELEGNYTGCMIGYHSASVIVDAYKKGIKNFDIEKAYKAMIGSASYDKTGIMFPSQDVENRLVPKAKLFNEQLGFIPSNLEKQSVSKALEYAYDDWCIAQMAKELGKKEDYDHFSERSKKYIQYFDTKTGFMRGKNLNGTWREPFDPRFSKHNANDYTEGNAYQWAWFVPHDVTGLIQLMGGGTSFTANLDQLFSVSSELTGGIVSEDISGMIGQYAHGNEPSHHISHLYNYAEQPWKTQMLTDKIMKTLYFNNPNGLVGNEDCGQMSAWYVFNAMGFYSFCPGDNQYSISRPIFDKVSIKLPNNTLFKVIVRNNKLKNKYIKSLKMNGKPMNKPFFSHEEILKGGCLEFEMGDVENKALFLPQIP